MTTHQFKLIFQKAHSDNKFVQFGYDQTYRGVVNFAMDVFGVDTTQLDKARWDDPQGQAITWTGTEDEVIGHRIKLKRMSPKVLHDFRMKAQSWLNSSWIPFRKQRQQIQNKLIEYEKTPDEEGKVWQSLQSSLLLFGVIMTDDIVKL